MRLNGTLKSWNDDRGFGFIAPADGGQDLFVHISAFPRGTGRPAVGEPVRYEPGYGREGRAKAIRVFDEDDDRPLELAILDSESEIETWPERPRRPFPLGILVSLLLLGAGAYFFFFADQELRDRGTVLFSDVKDRGTALYSEVKDRGEALFSEALSAQEPAGAPDPTFWCDGRVYCSQMTSCREAKFFLENCPGTKMDGDYDGIPCEKQWC